VGKGEADSGQGTAASGERRTLYAARRTPHAVRRPLSAERSNPSYCFKTIRRASSEKASSTLWPVLALVRCQEAP